MKKQNDEKWLDELISETINTEKPVFDAEKWKEKYAEEFEILRTRAEQSSASRPNIWRIVLQSRITRLAAAAAVIIVAIGVFVARMGPEQQLERPKISETAKSPAEMLTVASLNAAYRSGGIEEVEKQCERAMEALGPQPTKITVKELLAEFNGT